MPLNKLKTLVILGGIVLLLGCSETNSGKQVPADPVLTGNAEGPEFLEGRFKVYTLYRPQVQYRDFNGIFDISAGSARIVRTFWKVQFNALTRPGHYGEFFIEFFDYASSLAQSYPVENREKERMLDSLERSFHTFCAALDVAEAFEEFQQEQQRIYGD